MANKDETAALVIEHLIRQNGKKQYEEWLAEILKTVSAFSGYLGREVFPPGEAGKPYTIIVRFRNQTDLQKWLDSPERQKFIRSMEHAFLGGDKTTVKAGIDVWFTPENSPNKPPAYKQFLLTAAAIYPLTLIVPRALSPLFEAVPMLKNPFIGGLIISLIITGLMTYLIMPQLTGWLHDWLFAASKSPPIRASAEEQQTNV